MTAITIFLSITLIAILYVAAKAAYHRKSAHDRNRIIQLLNTQAHQFQQDHILREIENQLPQ